MKKKELEARIIHLEKRIDEMLYEVDQLKFTLRSPTDPWPYPMPVPTSQCRCPTCKVDIMSGMMGYVCGRADCPNNTTCVNYELYKK